MLAGDLMEQPDLPKECHSCLPCLPGISGAPRYWMFPVSQCFLFLAFPFFWRLFLEVAIVYHLYSIDAAFPTEGVSYITHIDVLIWLEMPAKNRKKQELPIRRASRPADSVVFSSCCDWGWHTKCSNGGTKLSKIIILQNVLRREIRAFMANNALTHAILKCWLFTWNILWTWCHWHPQHSPISNIFYPIQGCISSCTITILIYTFADPPEPRSSCSPVHSFHQVKRWACHTETQCHWEGRTRPSACGCLCLTSFFEPTRN